MTSAETGLPGRPKTSLRGRRHRGRRRRRSACRAAARPPRRPARRRAARAPAATWSCSPTETPPLITTTSLSSASARAASVAAASSDRLDERLCLGARERRERRKHVSVRAAHPARAAELAPAPTSSSPVSDDRDRAGAGRRSPRAVDRRRGRRARRAENVAGARASFARARCPRRRGGCRCLGSTATRTATDRRRASVSSTRITASAPPGTIAPVEIAIASPAPTRAAAGWPARDSLDDRSSSAGPSAPAPAVSAASGREAVHRRAVVAGYRLGAQSPPRPGPCRSASPDRYALAGQGARLLDHAAAGVRDLDQHPGHRRAGCQTRCDELPRARSSRSWPAGRAAGSAAPKPLSSSPEAPLIAYPLAAARRRRARGGRRRQARHAACRRSTVAVLEESDPLVHPLTGSAGRARGEPEAEPWSRSPATCRSCRPRCWPSSAAPRDTSRSRAAGRLQPLIARYEPARASADPHRSVSRRGRDRSARTAPATSRSPRPSWRASASRGGSPSTSTPSNDLAEASPARAVPILSAME